MPEPHQGAQLRTDLFVETLADAVAKAGGLGIARMLERQLGGDASHPKPVALALSQPAGHGGAGVGARGVDDLDDPNSEAPLPEDPTAPSIDEYQTKPAAGPHRRFQIPTNDNSVHPTSVAVPNPITRALNRYRERVEEMDAGSSSGSGRGDKP